MLQEIDTSTIENSRAVDSEGEVWKPVPGAPHVKASNLGRIKYQLRRSGNWVLVNPQCAPTARYPTVSIWDAERGCYRPHRVHRLVASAFHGPPPKGKPFAIHRDDDPANNAPTNLRWGDRRDNALDAIKTRRHGPCKLTAEQVAAMRRNYTPGPKAVALLAKRYSVSRWAIQNALAGRTFQNIEPPKAESYPWLKANR